MSAQSPAAVIDHRQIFAGLSRNWLRILIVPLAVAGMAFALAWLAAPQYRAVAQLKLGPAESSVLRKGGDTIVNGRGVATGMQVISSADILKQVAAKLDLARMPEFNDALKMSALSRFLVIAGLKSDPEEIPQEERVLKKIREKLDVRGDEKARVITIEFSSENARLAADIPNAMASFYLAGQGNAKLEPNFAAVAFLGPEVVDLQNKVKDADAKVAAFRAQSDLLMGGNSALATQQLSDLTNELSRVRAGRASAEAAIAVPAVGPASEPGKVALDPTGDPNAQGRKTAFVAALDPKGDVNPHALTALPSPYTLSAGSVIPASLITGLRSDLPGLVTAQVTENTYDSATGRCGQ